MLFVFYINLFIINKCNWHAFYVFCRKGSKVYLTWKWCQASLDTCLPAVTRIQLPTCQSQNREPAVQAGRWPGTEHTSHRKARCSRTGMMARPGRHDGEPSGVKRSANPPPLVIRQLVAGLRCCRPPAAANHPVHHHLRLRSQIPMANGLEMHKSMASFPPPAFFSAPPNPNPLRNKKNAISYRHREKTLLELR